MLRTLEGHTAPVSAVAVSANGTRAISASWDKTLKVWDPDSGEVLRTLEGHTGSVEAVAVWANGTRAISASNDGTLRVWDLHTGQLLRTLEGHTNSVRAVAVWADGTRAISASDDGTLKLWDLHTCKVLRTLQGHAGRVLAVAVWADGTRAISASWDKTLKVWDLDTGQVLRTLQGHADVVEAVAVAMWADGTRAISASYDNTLKLWDLDTGRCLATFTADGPIMACTVLGDRIIAGDRLGRIHVLRMAECREHAPSLRTRKVRDGGTPEKGSRQQTGGISSASPPTLDQKHRDRLVEILEACQSLRGLQQRITLVGRLPDDIAVRIDQAAAVRAHLTNIIDTCAQFRDGISALAAAVRWLEGDTIAMQNLDAFVSQLGADPTSP